MMSTSARHKSVKFSESIEDIQKLKQMEDEDEEEEELVPMKASTTNFDNDNFQDDNEEELVPMQAGSPSKKVPKQSPNLVKIEPNTIQKALMLNEQKLEEQEMKLTNTFTKMSQ